MTKRIKNAPSWLELTDDRTSFVFVPERAKVVREIFELSVAGSGGYSIAKLLNSKQVPAFGRSKRWDQSTIHNLLTNRAVLGEYQRKQTVEGKEMPVGDPVPGYYPAVVGAELFNAAHQARQRNLAAGRGRKGRFISNLFAGLLECSYCGAPVKFHSNGNVKSLICKTVLDRGECARFAWSYADFEQSFFYLLGQSDDFPELSKQLIRLKLSAEQAVSTEIYNVRSDIGRTIRRLVLRLTTNAAGDNPNFTAGDIRRSHPDRYFTVTLIDGSSRTGLSSPADVVSRRKLDPEKLTASLGVSPRQGQLIALLAHGEKLIVAAQQLGMTQETARWHLRQIFKKTNTHSQADLVHLAEASGAFAEMS